MSRTTKDEWIEWALNHDIEAEVVLASYLDAGQNDNPYIYNPRKPQLAFVSPRSLATASNIIRSRRYTDFIVFQKEALADE